MLCWKLFQVFVGITGGIEIDMHERVETCSAVIEEAQSQGVDPKLAAALSWVESRFYRNKVNPKSGAIGPLQVLPRYWCPNRKGEFSIHRADGVVRGCNTLEQGVYALKYYTEHRRTTAGAIASFGYKLSDSYYTRLTLKLHRCAKNPKRVECKRRGLR